MVKVYWYVHARHKWWNGRWRLCSSHSTCTSTRTCMPAVSFSNVHFSAKLATSCRRPSSRSSSIHAVSSRHSVCGPRVGNKAQFWKPCHPTIDPCSVLQTLCVWPRLRNKAQFESHATPLSIHTLLSSDPVCRPRLGNKVQFVSHAISIQILAVSALQRLRVWVKGWEQSTVCKPRHIITDPCSECPPETPRVG